MEKMRRRSNTGLTLIQAVIVVAVLALVAAIALAVVQGQQYKRAQSLVYTQPWDVLELRALPLKTEFTWDEEIVISCDLTNKTGYDLSLPELLGASLTFNDHIVATGGSLIGYQHLLKSRETLSQDIRLKTEHTGLPRPKNGPAGLARVVFHGRGHTTDLARSENGELSQSIEPGAPVLRSEEFEIAILVERSALEASIAQ